MTALWDEVDGVLALEEPQREEERIPIARRRRRAFSEDELDGRSALELVRDAEGTLRWVYQPPARQVASGRRVYRSLAVDRPQLVKRFRFYDLGPNQVTEALQALDAKLTPAPGLKQWQGGAWQPVAEPAAAAGPVLLLVHGTFSKVQMFTDELAATGPGRELLQRWQDAKGKYAAVLGFDHSTLSVGAWSNAVDLMQALRGLKGPVDVVCHSRGGLVVCWLLRLAEVPVRRVVFVGSPLTGTSLASPYRLRAALDMLANYGDAIATLAGVSSAVVPLAAGAAGIARIFGKTLRLGSSLPIADGAVALVPGLATQQRSSNNLEIRQLFGTEWKARPQMSAVRVNFRPEETDQGWKFWRRFSHVGDQLLFSAADLVFEGDNDLVVDTEAMVQLGETGVIDDLRDLGTSAATHHCSYFRNEEVLRFIGERM